MYNNDSNSLNAGAPDIRLTGNQDPNQQMASYGYDDAMAESRQAYEQGLKDGTVPFDMEFEEYLELMRDQSKAPQQNSGIMASAPTGTYTQQRKQMMAGGGIAGLEKRQGYFLGDLVDKIKDDLIPNELKENPIATALLGGAAVNQFGLIPGMGGAVGDFGKNWLGELLGGRDAVLGEGTGQDFGDPLINFSNIFGTKDTSTAEKAAQVLSQPGGYFGEDQEDDVARMMESMGLNTPEKLYRAVTTPGFKLTDPSTWMGGITNALSSAASPYLGEGAGRRVNPLYPLGIGAAVGKYVEGLPKDELPMDTTSIDPAAIATAARGTDAEGAAAGLRFLPPQVTRAAEGGRIGYAMGAAVEDISTMDDSGIDTFKETGPYEHEGAMQKNPPGLLKIFKTLMMSGTPVGQAIKVAKLMSKRMGAQEGGLMNLGGMEKDYRNEGGFVALGGKEKADDVPARLSKNEFVFTADAVRGAGGGDIDQGAEIMENMMKHLEAGGEVSEDSQGLEGARGMFANAQQLEKRII